MKTESSHRDPKKLFLQSLAKLWPAFRKVRKGCWSGKGLRAWSPARLQFTRAVRLNEAGAPFSFLASVDGEDRKEFWFPLRCSWTLRTASWASALRQTRASRAELQTLKESRQEHRRVSGPV